MSNQIEQKMSSHRLTVSVVTTPVELTIVFIWNVIDRGVGYMCGAP